MPLYDLACEQGCNADEPLRDQFLPVGAIKNDIAVDLTCDSCHGQLKAVYDDVHIMQGKVGQTTILNNGLTITSSDHSVCATGRELAGNLANRVQPGETTEIDAFGASIAITRSTDGGKIDVIRTDL